MKYSEASQDRLISEKRKIEDRILELDSILIEKANRIKHLT